MICVDANVLIAALDSHDLFHVAASEELVRHDDIVALSVTLGEALVHPYRIDKAPIALELLDQYGVSTVDVTEPIALRASQLRAQYGNRNFPMLDALVVAAGIEGDIEVVTTDDKWPEIPASIVRVLLP